ncbi:unnamed protein product, partial [Mesorhabditis belari]|uniref:Transmembrane protein n=1 Tax=Mesorhabditis belari TaxID=2138241 RepID=A0AAF3FLB4_9BILA
MKTKFSQERCSGATPKQSFLQYQKCFPNTNVADLLACSPPNETCAGIVSGLQCQQDVYQEKCNASSAFADIMYIDAVNGFNNFSNCTTEVATNFHSKVTTSNFWLYIAIALGVLGFLGVIAASVAYNKAQINPQTKRYS